MSVTSHDDHGGQCQYDQVPGETVCDRAWINLVIAMAGNVADLEHGHHDQGARADIRAALEGVATIISTGHRPAVIPYPGGHAGVTSIEVAPVASDVLLSGATTTAKELLLEHAGTVRVITTRLARSPQQVLYVSDLHELSTITTRARA